MKNITKFALLALLIISINKITAQKQNNLDEATIRCLMEAQETRLSPDQAKIDCGCSGKSKHKNNNNNKKENSYVRRR